MLFIASSARRVLITLSAGGLVLGSAVHVQAADEGGLGGLFQQLFSPQPAPAPQPVPAPVAPPSSYGQARSNYGSGRYGYGHGRREWRQSARRRQLQDAHAQLRPKARYAALPKSDKATAKPEKTRHSPNFAELWKYASNPDAALMHDATLRRGDIVITTSGPKVFTGKRGEQHAASEFELVSRSSAVDRKTRMLLAAMVAPRGALPADEARKMMATLQRPSNHTDVPAARQTQTAGLRVVYPSGRQGGAVRVSLQND
ncbi:hypothetical protein ACRAWG_00425 [Methylobacterium sp. P31]